MKNLLNTRHADGLIIMGDLLNGQKEIQQVVSMNRAVVSLFRKPFPGIGSVVTVDNDKGIELALTHLFELGHDKIGFLGYDWLDDTELRQEAFEGLMEATGRSLHPSWIQIGKGGIDGGYDTMKAMLSQSDPPTAVVACDDLTAIGAVSAARDMGIDVPRDVSIVGFDDIHISRYLPPPLTTVRMPVLEISTKVCELLVEAIRSGGTRVPGFQDRARAHRSEIDCREQPRGRSRTAPRQVRKSRARERENLCKRRMIPFGT